MAMVLCRHCRDYIDVAVLRLECPHEPLPVNAAEETYDIEKKHSYVGKKVKFIKGFFRGTRAFVAQYHGYSKVAGHIFEVTLLDGARIITTERHIKIEGTHSRKHRGAYASR